MIVAGAVLLAIFVPAALVAVANRLSQPVDDLGDQIPDGDCFPFLPHDDRR